MMNSERIFVSGGAGVIGHELVPRLVARGAEVWVGDLKPRPKDFPVSVRYKQGDLNYLTAGEVAAFGPTVFIHLAATFERSAETYEFWEENFWHNLRLSHHLMTLLRDQPSLKRVVFASSYLIYEPSLYQFEAPQNEAVSLKESDPIWPRNLTGMAKLAHEIELRYLESFRGEVFSSVSVRIYRGYGRHSRDIISRWIRMALANDALTVFRPEGRFDYIYAADTAEGLIRLAEARDVTGIINLGTGRARRVADVLDVLKGHFPKLKMVNGFSDIPFEASQADMTRFRAELGWVPPTDLEQAIPEMIAYERTRLREPPFRRLRNVLVSSAARKVPLIRAVIESARRLSPDIRVFAGDLDPTAPAGLVADSFLTLPRTETENTQALRDVCVSNGIGTVIPTRDGELGFWAEHAPYFHEAGIEVIVSNLDAVTLSLDKKAFAEFGRSNALPFIPVLDKPVGPGPFVVKERFGAASASLGLNLDNDAAMRHAATLVDPIIQPYIKGDESSIDAWFDRHHQLKGLILRRREHIVNGESVVTTTFRDQALEAECRRVLESMNLRGPIVAQVLRDADGHCHVIEVNARFGGASTTSVAAGLDIWYWTLYEADGGDADDLPYCRIDGEVRQVRVPSDIHIYDTHF
jgi:carbamoyl-phosphate synthase large subunit